MSLPPPPLISLPEPRRAGKLRDFLEILLFFLLAVTLYFVVQLAAVVIVIVHAHEQQPGVPWDTLIRQVGEQIQYSAHFLVPVQLIYYAVILLVLWLLICRLRNEPFAAGLAFRPFPARYLALAVLAGLLFAPVVQAANLLWPPPEPLLLEKMFTSKTAVWMLLGLAVLAAPLMEELMFRGYLFGLFERLGGPRLAVLATGILFGSIHFPQLYPGYFQMALLCIVGIVFSAVRARTGTVVAAIAVHFGYNLALTLGYFFSDHFRALPP